MIPSSHVQDLFQRFITPLWLRPERALYEAHLYQAFLDFLGNDFESPSLEYGCADGILSFMMLGGECSSDFDDYLDVHTSRNSYREQQMLESDYFDQPAENFQMETMMRERPKNHFTTGISWKKSHIEKARRLNADLFISLHANSASDRNVAGFSIYTLSEKSSDKQAELLAQKENRADIIAGVNFGDTSGDILKTLIDLSQRSSMPSGRRRSGWASAAGWAAAASGCRGFTSTI